MRLHATSKHLSIFVVRNAATDQKHESDMEIKTARSKSTDLICQQEKPQVILKLGFSAIFSNIFDHLRQSSTRKSAHS